MQNDDYEIQGYASYNGLSRTANVYGIPYMAGMAVFSVASLTSLACAFAVGGVVWLYPLALGASILAFLKLLCENDDAGLDIFLLEIKWRVIKLFLSDGQHHGNTLTIHPTDYGNKVKYEQAKKFFKNHVK